MEREVCPRDGKATVPPTSEKGRATLAALARVGSVLGDRYRLDALLGRGGFGDVYQAFHLGTHESVAVKVLRADVSAEPGAAERFTAEARLCASLRHPNSVRVFDFGTTAEGLLYLAMEWLRGRSLEAVLQTEGRLPPARALAIVAQVCKSLAEAHGRQIVHRDLKPENIFLESLPGEPEFVRVIDFGIAKFLGGSQQFTASGAILGTPYYMSPEQVRGESIDARADLYALGVVLFRCLTGQFPFTGDTPFKVLAAHLHEPTPDVRAHAAVDEPLAALVTRCLARDRDARHASADALRGELEACLRSPATAPRPAVDTGQDDVSTQAMDVIPPELFGVAGDDHTQAMSLVRVVDDTPVVPLAPTAVPRLSEAPPPPPDEEAATRIGISAMPDGPAPSRRPSASLPQGGLTDHTESRRKGLQRRSPSRSAEPIPGGLAPSRSPSAGLPQIEVPTTPGTPVAPMARLDRRANLRAVLWALLVAVAVAALGIGLLQQQMAPPAVAACDLAEGSEGWCRACPAARQATVGSSAYCKCHPGEVACGH
jgi:serine/threonine protein kinase